MGGELKCKIRGLSGVDTSRNACKNLLFKIKNNVETKKHSDKIILGKGVGNATGKLYLHFPW